MKRKYLLLLFACYALLSYNVLITYVINAGFEDGDRTNGGKFNLNTSGLSCSVDGMQVGTLHSRVGTMSIRSKVLSTDAVCGSSFRDEYQIKDSSAQHRFYAISIYPENYYPGGVVDSKNESIVQWKISQYFPLFSVWIQKDPSGLYSNLVAVKQYNTSSPTATSPNVSNFYTIGRLYSDTWTDLAFDYNWQSNGTGTIKVYLNNNPTPVLTILGQNQYLPNPANPSSYFHVPWRNGIYKFGGWNDVSQRILYIDEVKVGSAGVITDYFVAPAADVNPPLLTALTPLDNATNLPINIGLTAVFNENIKKGSGNILIKENGVTVQTIDVNSASVNITANTMTIVHPNFSFSSNVNIEFSSGVIKDMSDNNFAGLNSTAWNFTTLAAPVVPVPTRIKSIRRPRAI